MMVQSWDHVKLDYYFVISPNLFPFTINYASRQMQQSPSIWVDLVDYLRTSLVLCFLKGTPEDLYMLKFAAEIWFNQSKIYARYYSTSFLLRLKEWLHTCNQKWELLHGLLLTISWYWSVSNYDNLSSPRPVKNWLCLVNSCVYYAHQTHEIDQGALKSTE